MPVSQNVEQICAGRNDGGHGHFRIQRNKSSAILLAEGKQIDIRNLFWSSDFGRVYKVSVSQRDAVLPKVMLRS